MFRIVLTQTLLNVVKNGIAIDAYCGHSGMDESEAVLYMLGWTPVFLRDSKIYPSQALRVHPDVHRTQKSTSQPVSWRLTKI